MEWLNRCLHEDDLDEKDDSFGFTYVGAKKKNERESDEGATDERERE